MKKILFVGAILIVAMLSGCATPTLNGQVYSGSQESLQPQNVVMATVVAVRNIQIRESSRYAPTGAAVGGVGGAGIGAAVGGLRGAVIGGVVGLIGGAVIGSQNEANGELITVQNPNSGNDLAIPQPMAKGEKPFFVGEHVQVIEGTRRDRILPAN